MSFNEKISIKKVRELCNTILDGLFNGKDSSGSTMDENNIGKKYKNHIMQKFNRASLMLNWFLF